MGGIMIVWHGHSCLCRNILLKDASTGKSAGATRVEILNFKFEILNFMPRTYTSS
jgi:hypothetical protein